MIFWFLAKEFLIISLFTKMSRILSLWNALKYVVVIIFSTTQALVEEENYLFLYFARLKKKITLIYIKY